MHAVSEEDAFALDVGAALGKEIPQLRYKIIAIRQWIEREIDFAARRESPLKIAKKKIPFAWSPARVRRPISIKTDRKRGDPIELLVKIRERLERLNSENRSWHAENFEQFPEERRFVKVEAKNGMTESFQDEQKKAATTA